MCKELGGAVYQTHGWTKLWLRTLDQATLVLEAAKRRIEREGSSDFVTRYGSTVEVREDVSWSLC